MHYNEALRRRSERQTEADWRREERRVFGLTFLAVFLVIVGIAVLLA